MMEVKRREPIAVVEYVLRRLERQAIDIGSHPVLIHEGLEALNRLREENARLRQRVEELERAPRCCADTIPPGCRTCRCADAAEARLAKVVEHWTDVEARSAEAHEVYQQEAHRRGDVRHPDAYADLSEATKEWDRVLVRWVHATCAALAAAQTKEEK